MLPHSTTQDAEKDGRVVGTEGCGNGVFGQTGLLIIAGILAEVSLFSAVGDARLGAA
ncbi:MAG: hypothetical protein WCJ35_17090 [Planctomycetota bacterium]